MNSRIINMDKYLHRLAVQKRASLLMSLGICTNCGKNPIHTSSKRRCEICLAKRATKQKEYRKENPQKVLQSQKNSTYKNPKKYRLIREKYRVSHKELWNKYAQDRRARKASAKGSFSPDEWHNLLTFYGNKCICCGSTNRIEADHVIPISKGGNNDISNIQPLCRTCNARKGTKIIDYRCQYFIGGL